MFSFLLHTKLHECGWCTARCLDANKLIFMEHSFSVPTSILISLYQLLCLSPPCLCFIFLYIFCSLCLYWFSVLFLEVLVEAITPTLPSQQRSSINKRTAPHCTIMGKNKLPSLDLPSCSHSFNTNYLMLLCANMFMQLCVCTCMKRRV